MKSVVSQMQQRDGIKLPWIPVHTSRHVTDCRVIDIGEIGIAVRAPLKNKVRNHAVEPAVFSFHVRFKHRMHCYRDQLVLTPLQYVLRIAQAA